MLRSFSLPLTMLLELFIHGLVYAQSSPAIVSSPDNKIAVKVWISMEKTPLYSITYDGREVLSPSRLGLRLENEDFSANLSISSVNGVEKVSDNYQLFTGKRTNPDYKANKRTFRFLNNARKQMDVIFQVSNDGVAFRYYFPQKSSTVHKVTEELTSFHFPQSAKAWLQPMSVAKSGWESTNPAYEEHYKQNIAVGTPAPTDAGWIYPALFESNKTWLLITEAGLDSNYCATRLKAASPDGEYQVGFPNPKEVIKDGSLHPRSKMPFGSPWRVITIGGLNSIIESTLGTDLAKPAVSMDRSFIKPGKSSWSWIMSKDDFIVYDEQKKYIDLAADMRWQYCLVDVNWDVKIGYEKMKELADYAASKNVGMLVWYNSAGDWNTVKYTPKDKLLTAESRAAEFSRLQKMGIKGVKIDFFGGDGQSVIKYYLEILEDAAKYKLLVNFHGATLPRGWHRTYPNLVTTEAVRGFEMITFGQADADLEATHCAMLPFTRNAFDPMDFTPMNLYKIPTKVIRKTTGSFELALSVLFLSGIQHYAESPEGMSHIPDHVKTFLRELPDQWADSKFIDGYPGRLVVVARKSSKGQWYVSGINGENTEKELNLDLSSLKPLKGGRLITDGEEEHTFASREISSAEATKLALKLKPNGGFVIVLQ